MDKRLDWEFSTIQKIDEHHLYIDGGEIFGPICPDSGYFVWATASIDVFGDIIIYGDGLTKKDAMTQVKANIKKFMEMFNG